MTTVNVDYWQPTGRLIAQADWLFSKGGSHRWLQFFTYTRLASTVPYGIQKNIYVQPRSGLTRLVVASLVEFSLVMAVGLFITLAQQSGTRCQMNLEI